MGESAGIAPAGSSSTLPTTIANSATGSSSPNDTLAAVRAGTAGRSFALAALGACLLAGWMLQHPYAGISHDCMLYTFQALARVHPRPLAHDIFLRFGSQDQYTLFSPLYATAIRLLGLDPAAAILTFLAQVLFFCSAWLLARRFMTAELALLAVGLLVVLPSGYGAGFIFSYTEEYLTPRQLAEAFVLAGVAAALSQRRGWSLACIAIAVSLHPIMGFAGAALLLSQHLVIPKPKLAAAVASTGFLTLVGIAFLAPIGPFARMDDTWLHLVEQRSSFLFISSWFASDWARTLLPLGVLAVGAVMATERSIRLFCSAALITAAGGVIVSLLGGDLARIVIVLQAQAWRWLWLANVAAVLLTPAIFRDCWRSGALARTTALLLVAAWISRGQSVTLCSLLIGGAFAAAIAARRGISFKHETWLVRAAAGAVAAFLLASLVSKLQVISLNRTAFDAPLSIELQLAQLWSQDGIIPATIIVAVWLAGRRRSPAFAQGAIVATGVLACALLWPSTWSAWSDQQYPSKLYQAYAPLRDRIPLNAEVFWPDFKPEGIWYLLERDSYVSSVQTAGIVFSRAAAVAMSERVQRIGPLGHLQFAGWLPPQSETLAPEVQLRRACSAPDLDYVVSWQDLGPPPLASYMPDPHHANVRSRLYRCADLRVSP